MDPEMQLHIEHIANSAIQHLPMSKGNWEKYVSKPNEYRLWTHPSNQECWEVFQPFGPEYVRLVENRVRAGRGQAPLPEIEPKPVEKPGPCVFPLSEAKSVRLSISTKPLVLVDTMNLIFRSHFAMRGLTYEGIPTGALYGFLRAITTLLKLSDEVVFCWDNGLPGDKRKRIWKRTLYEPYKATRKRTADTVAVMEQLPLFYKATKILGLGNAGIPGVEADDIIALLASPEFSGTREVYIYSSDIDLLQLLEEKRVRVIRPTKDGNKLITVKKAEKEFGIPIEKWPAFLTFGGDSSDNIHVLRGVGKKGAAEMVELGIDPTKKWKEQTEAVQNSKYQKFRSVWKDVRAVYRVAHLPRSLKDPRLQVVPEIDKIVADYTRKPETDKQWRLLTQFLADYGMAEFLGSRRKFFPVE